VVFIVGFGSISHFDTSFYHF